MVTVRHDFNGLWRLSWMNATVSAATTDARHKRDGSASPMTGQTQALRRQQAGLWWTMLRGACLF